MNSKVSIYCLSWDIKEILQLKIYVWLICFGAAPKHRGLKPQLLYPGPNPVGQELRWDRGASQLPWTVVGRGPGGSVPALPCLLFSTLHLLSLEAQNGFSVVLTCIYLVFSLCTVGRKLKNGVTTIKNNMGVPPKVKNRISTWSSSSICGRTSEEMESLILGYLHPCIHCSINHSSQAMGTAQMSMDRWTDTEKVDYTQSVIQPIKKYKKEILPLATTWMNLGNIMLSEMRMSTGWVRHNLVYVRNLEQWTHRSWGHSSGWGRRREDGEASSRQKVSGVQDQWIVEFYPTPQCLLTHNMVLSIKSMLSVLPTEQQNKHNNQRGRRKPPEVMPMSVTLMVGMI